MLFSQNPLHTVEGAAAFLSQCSNCNNSAWFTLVYCKQGPGLSPPIIRIFTDRFTLMEKAYFLQCPVCGDLMRVDGVVVSLLQTVSKCSNGWHLDPLGRHQLRWWDGVRWSTFVADDNRVSVDALQDS